MKSENSGMGAVGGLPRKRQPKTPRRTVSRLGKTFKDAPYRPQYAIGIMCADETDQKSVYGTTCRVFPTHEKKVLVI